MKQDDYASQASASARSPQNEIEIGWNEFTGTPEYYVARGALAVFGVVLSPLILAGIAIMGILWCIGWGVDKVARRFTG